MAAFRMQSRNNLDDQIINQCYFTGKFIFIRHFSENAGYGSRRLDLYLRHNLLEAKGRIPVQAVIFF